MVDIKVNGKNRTVAIPEGKPLLWTLREDLDIKGPKFGCGYGLCGACTVLVDGKATRSCVYRASGAEGKDVTSIEGLNDRVGAVLKEAWEEFQVPQCGYCQPGMIMAAASAIYSTPDLELESVVQKVTNICRCGTYQQIRQALEKALTTLQQEGESNA